MIETQLNEKLQDKVTLSFNYYYQDESLFNYFYVQKKILILSMLYLLAITLYRFANKNENVSNCTKISNQTAKYEITNVVWMTGKLNVKSIA